MVALIGSIDGLLASHQMVHVRMLAIVLSVRSFPCLRL